MTWQDRSLCGLETQHLFFDIDGNGRYIHLSEAKAMCSECPVEARCVDDALSDTFRKGIWGGMTERERDALRATLDSQADVFHASIGAAIERVIVDVEEETMRRMQGVL